MRSFVLVSVHAEDAVDTPVVGWCSLNMHLAGCVSDIETQGDLLAHGIGVVDEQPDLLPLLVVAVGEYLMVLTDVQAIRLHKSDWRRSCRIDVVVAPPSRKSSRTSCRRVVERGGVNRMRGLTRADVEALVDELQDIPATLDRAEPSGLEYYRGPHLRRPQPPLLRTRPTSLQRTGRPVRSSTTRRRPARRAGQRLPCGVDYTDGTITHWSRICPNAADALWDHACSVPEVQVRIPPDA